MIEEGSLVERKFITVKIILFLAVIFFSWLIYYDISVEAVYEQDEIVTNRIEINEEKTIYFENAVRVRIEKEIFPGSVINDDIIKYYVIEE